MEFENKLAAYRVKRNREETIQKLKQKVKGFFNWKQKTEVVTQLQEPLIQKEDTDTEQPEISERPEELETNVIKSERSWPTLGLYASAIILWGFLWNFFIIQGFGTVFLILSALFGIYFNTRTGPKDENEISAYSVFNKNCESIDGTLTAEQFEREIRYGPQSMH